jgi:hypothetical protein
MAAWKLLCSTGATDRNNRLGRGGYNSPPLSCFGLGRSSGFLCGGLGHNWLMIAWGQPSMSDAKATEKGDRQDRAPDQVRAPEAQAARVAGAADMASAEKTRTNASDGSLRKYSAEHIAAQEASIELVYEGRTASRTEKKTERELLREMANKPENVNTQGLESIAKDQSLPEDKRALAGMIQEMRTQSKALGTPTDALDSYAREALQAELLAKSKTQLPQNDDQEACGSFSYTDAKKGMTIGSKTYSADQLLAQGNMQNPVVTDATNARVTDVPREKTLLYGHVSEPDPWDKVAALPEKTQAEIVLTAIRANAEHWGREQAQRQIGTLMGATEGVGQILQDMATITDFNHACLTGDKETAAKMGGAFGDSFGRMLVGGVNILKISDDYLQDLGAQGDWTKPAKDLARLSQSLDRAWAELPPMEQERLKSRFVTEFAANAVMPGASARLLKAGKFTEVLPNMVKIACKSGAELKQVPADIAKARTSFQRLLKNAFGPQVVTPEGVQMGLGEAEELYMMSKADDLAKEALPPKEIPSSRKISDYQQESHIPKELIESRIAKNGKIDSAEGFQASMDIRDALRAVCKKMGININDKNVAFAEIDIPGKPSKMVAINGKLSPTGTCAKPESPIFKAIPSGAQPRDVDSEYKILEEIARGLDPEDQTIKGTVALFTEQEPCERSCQKVIAEFEKRFDYRIKVNPSWKFKNFQDRKTGVFEEVLKRASRDAQ